MSKSSKHKVNTQLNRFKSRQRRFAIIIVAVLVTALILSLAAPIFFML